ncbi:hypothetical protein AOC36_10575 [Erysipelothrix larvae]|uniref:Uncharacterized protein n=1 Tax=Erysipelothrix larvae TaxID=1514105 RepID=A0A0X8H1U3_9FIRM|nr:hypothetical protein [Erysipelothrix larvae]AMC94399.1 hypothetical protein AOC36_10575 [Erysipelothrix larvae]
MNDKDYYKRWAPFGMRWVDWVRPVLFIGLSERAKDTLNVNFSIPKIHYIETLKKDTAILLDMPSYEGVLEGLACATLGYRPIVLYNGTTQQDQAMSLVDNADIQHALIWGTPYLETLTIRHDAPPVFMIDTNRMLRYKMNASIFDNSWDLYNQDIPSPQYFKQQGIDKIIIRSEKLQRDLAKIFYEFQKKGITIYITDGYDAPKVIDIPKPPKKDNFH